MMTLNMGNLDDRQILRMRVVEELLMFPEIIPDRKKFESVELDNLGKNVTSIGLKHSSGLYEILPKASEATHVAVRTPMGMCMFSDMNMQGVTPGVVVDRIIASPINAVPGYIRYVIFDKKAFERFKRNLGRR